ncbi:MAG: hypothetical protein ACRCW4_00490 [Candidatus Neomicrothrix subdominans]
MTRPLTAEPDEIRANGKHLGRFIWIRTSPRYGRDAGDWSPDPNGTHDGYIHQECFYCLERQP